VSTYVPPPNPQQPQPGPDPYAQGFAQQPAAPVPPYAQPGVQPPFAAQPGAPMPSYAAPAYPQAGAAYPMTPQRNTLVFVTSIILIVGAAIALFGVIALAGAIGAYDSQVLSSVDLPSKGVLGLLVVVGLIGTVFDLFVGITGVRNASNPAKGDFLVKLGIILVAWALINTILNFVLYQSGGPFQVILGFILPVLFLVGAFNLKNQARTA